MLNHYHSLVPLEDLERVDVSPVLGLRSNAMKGVSSIDGKAHVLRRMDHNRLVPNSELVAAAKETVNRWMPFRGHPHVAALCGTFVSADMRDTPSLYFAHTYYPGASTLEATHCSDKEGSVPASEAELWNYASQLCCTSVLYMAQDSLLEEQLRYLPVILYVVRAHHFPMHARTSHRA